VNDEILGQLEFHLLFKNSESLYLSYGLEVKGYLLSYSRYLGIREAAHFLFTQVIKIFLVYLREHFLLE
jgi:hypothetical protein